MPTFGDVNVMLKIPIPFLVILWIYMMKFLLCDNSKYKVRKIIVIILLAVAALNPISEIKGRCKNIVKYHYFMVDNQKIDMLNLPKYYKAQYLTVDKETFFFKYLARNDSIKKS